MSDADCTPGREPCSVATSWEDGGWGDELGPYLLPYQVAFWFIQPFGHNRHRPKSGGLLCLLFCNVAWVEAYLHTKWYRNPSNRLATIYQRHRQTGQTDRQRSDSI